MAFRFQKLNSHPSLAKGSSAQLTKVMGYACLLVCEKSGSDDTSGSMVQAL